MHRRKTWAMQETTRRHMKKKTWVGSYFANSLTVHDFHFQPIELFWCVNVNIAEVKIFQPSTSARQIRRGEREKRAMSKHKWMCFPQFVHISFFLLLVCFLILCSSHRNCVESTYPYIHPYISIYIMLTYYSTYVYYWYYLLVRHCYCFNPDEHLNDICFWRLDLASTMLLPAGCSMVMIVMMTMRDV